MRLFLALCLFCCSFTLTAQGKMTLRKMEKAFQKADISYEGDPGAWLLYTQDHILLVLSDPGSNRMRIFTPIIEAADARPLHLEKMLRANFHSALDAKYSIHDGFVVSVFTHPLKELSREQLLNAIDQVIALSKTFGTTYSSTDLHFGEPDEQGELEEKQKTGKRT
ncbi:MAG: hypothetical protein RIC19_10890 [Phaeodactylibacter sp.]|uniref:hypothetical protein n=1 Tax=Phaeodactylibacter sp. TaxID=1940289 RepID=UPI0032ECFAA6